MKKLLPLLLIVLGAYDLSAQSITRLFGSSPFQDSLWVFDTTNFSVVRRLAPSITAGTLTGMNGIAKNPATGDIYVVVKQSAVSGRVLGILNPSTAVVTAVGNLGDNFSSITFNGNNTLLGVTGDGATTPETVYRINQTTAAKTVLRTMGNGADGEVICYNPTDNMIYHWSGNGTVVFEKMDTSGVTITGIPIIGTTNGETFGMVALGNNKFLGSNISSSFNRWNANGTVSAAMGSAPDDIRGTALVTCTRTVTAPSNGFCTGSSLTLTANGGGFPTAYQWYYNGAIIAGATASTYSANQAGHYNCMITDECGADSTGNAGINIVENPLPVVNVSGNSVVCSNGVVTLTGTSGGTSQWYMNGSPIVGANSPTYQTSQAGVYNMTKTNTNGCTDSAATGITVTVVQAPVVALGADSTQCGGSITLDAQNAGATYLWIDSTTAQTLTVSTSGMYSVTVTDANNCVSSDTINVTIHALPTPSIGNDTTVCGSITLDGGSGYTSYMWCDGSTTQTTTMMASGTCAVTVTDSNGCSGSDTITFIVNPNPTVSLGPDVTACGSALLDAGAGFTSYVWCNATTGQTNLITSSGTCYVTVVDPNGCSGSDTINITINNAAPPTAQISDNTLCFDDGNAVLTAIPTGGTFTGPGVSGTSFDPSTAGNGTHNIVYTYTDVNGCSASDTITVTVSACVGITEHSATQNISIYPNPNTGSFTLTLNDNSQVVNVFDATGKLIFSETLRSGTHTIDGSNWAAGVYTVQAVSGTTVSQQRLVISR